MLEKFKYRVCHCNPPYGEISPRKIVYSLIRYSAVDPRAMQKFYFKNQNDFNFVNYGNIFLIS